MGQAEAVSRWKRQPCLQHFPWIRGRRGRQPESEPGAGGNDKADIPAIPAGIKPVCHRKEADGAWHQKPCWEGYLAPEFRQEHSHQREVQRGCVPAEAVHGGLPYENAEEVLGGNPAVLCEGKPRGNHSYRNMGAGTGGN